MIEDGENGMVSWDLEELMRIEEPTRKAENVHGDR